MVTRSVLSLARAAPLAALLLVAACESSVGPRGEIRVVLDSVGAPSIGAGASGQLVMVCPVHLTVFNAGAQAAHWYSGVLGYYPGGDTTGRADSIGLFSQDLAAIWGGSPPDSEVRHGDGTWYAAAPAPYFGVATFQTQSDVAENSFGTASFAFRCGVSRVGVHPSAASPVISAFSVSGSDTVTGANIVPFKVTLAATNGLWTVQLHDITSACAWDQESAWTTMPTSYDGSLGMWFPGCPPGPRAITLTVRDAFLHQTVDTTTVYVR